MTAKKSSTRVTEPTVTLVPVPLDADCYYVQGDMTDLERKLLKLAWEKMNQHLPKPKLLMHLPEGIDLNPMPSSVLRKWIESCTDILKERGEA